MGIVIVWKNYKNFGEFPAVVFSALNHSGDKRGLDISRGVYGELGWEFEDENKASVKSGSCVSLSIALALVCLCF